ncbi:MAG: protein phosphatase 2C domain-containing protein [Anaerolineales bacterium]|nr:protein phosphatase 2C domain-containing protein [Anaerolineales bacterium]
MIPQETLHLTALGQSHTGNRRTQNEDRFAIRSYHLEGGQNAALVIVADGIGGHQAGEIAAEYTVNTILRSIESSSMENPVGALETAVIEAGRAVSQAAAEHSERQGMGSTVALALVIEDRLYTTTVGDSRIYLLRKGRLRQVSTDHTWIQEAIEYDILTPEEAQGHPQAHVLRRHIGGDQLPEPDLRLRLKDGESDQDALRNQGTQLYDDDRLLLCTDGLTDMVPDLEIYNALATMPPEEALDHLVQRALKAGGNDNITIAIIALPKKIDVPPRVIHRRRWGRNTLLATGLLVILILAGVFFLWWLGLWL